jgi:hypothetical protein
LQVPVAPLSTQVLHGSIDLGSQTDLVGAVDNPIVGVGGAELRVAAVGVSSETGESAVGRRDETVVRCDADLLRIADQFPSCCAVSKCARGNRLDQIPKAGSGERRRRVVVVSAPEKDSSEGDKCGGGDNHDD